MINEGEKSVDVFLYKSVFSVRLQAAVSDTWKKKKGGGLGGSVYPSRVYAPM